MLANAGQTNLARPRALQHHPAEAYTVEVFGPQGTCSGLRHTAYQPCRGTAYSASGPSWAGGDARKVTATGEVLGTEQCSCRSYAGVPEESVATSALIGSCNQVFPATRSLLSLEALA